jgi:hypothetical protein
VDLGQRRERLWAWGDGGVSWVVTAIWAGVVLLAVVCWRPSLLSPRHWRMRRRKWRKWAGKSGRGKPPTRAVYRAVMAADGRRCVFCGSADRPQWDHIFPDALGYRATKGNGAVLCWVHNRVKSDYHVDRHGRVNYHPWPGYADRDLAAAILARELEVRRGLVRRVRLALAA